MDDPIERVAQWIADFEDMGHSLRRRINKMLAEERQYTDRVAFLEAFRIHLQADIV